MSRPNLMMLDGGNDHFIRCRFISEWFKIDSYVHTNEGLLSEIEKNRPDGVVLDINLFKRIGGIETARKISDRFDIPVWFE